MAGLLDDIDARVSAIVAGAYPASPGSPYIPASTFTAGEVFLPAENARFPNTGAAKVTANRLFDLTWPTLSFDPPGSENGLSGPWVRSATLVVRVQYALARPPKLAPSTAELALGAMRVASRRALSDAALIQWALLRPGAFAGLAIGVLLDQDATVEKADAQRAVGLTRVRFLVAQSAVTSPGVAT